MQAQFWISAGILVLQAVALAAGLFWKLAQTGESIRRSVDQEHRSMQAMFTKLQTRVGDVELTAHKTFVRRDSFNEVIERLMTRHDRLEEKMDRILERIAISKKAGP